MFYNENSPKVKCQFLRDNPGLDEVEYCPRRLASCDKRLLLDALAVELIEFGENLQSFISDNYDVDFSPYFDLFYHDIARSVRFASRNLHLKYIEPSFT